MSHLPAGRLEVDGASSVGYRAFHPHEEVAFRVQLFAFFTKDTSWKTKPDTSLQSNMTAIKTERRENIKVITSHSCL